MKYAIGTDVVVNGNKEGVVQSYDKELGMYEVRLFDGGRVVGSVVVPESAITPATPVSAAELDYFNAYHPAD